MSEPVDLTNCDREPIHIPGAVQPHGCLIACDDALSTVQRVSENAAGMLGVQGELVGKTLAEIFGEVCAHDIRNAAAAQQGSRAGLLLGLKLDGGAFDVAVHRYKGAGIVEFEPSADVGRGSPLDLARALVGAFSACADIPALLARTPRLLRGALGYDRVMIYQFAHDGAGKVMSEAKRSDLEGFLGQHFPHTDIPQQARALYLQSTLRIISSAAGERAAIHPEFDASGEPLDLSFAHLRSVSPVHLEYLRNMGVGASMSVSIVVDGKLWGLIACHHYAPHTLSMTQRVAVEMAGRFFSLQVEALSRRATLEAATRARAALDRVMRNVSYRGDIADSLRERLEDFESFMPGDGVGIWIGGAWSGRGAQPPQKAVAPLMRFLAAVADGKVWATHALSTHHAPAERYCAEVSGVLAIPLSQTPRDYLVFFRREVIQSLDWAGDPNKTYEVGPLGDRLTPRKSFAIWKETVERQSAPWTEEDREMAEAARTALLEVIMRHTEILESERATADLRQKLLNEELNHRVKNILSLIKSLVSQPAEEGRSLAEYAEALKGRIMALAHAHDQVVRNDGGGPLQGLLNAELTPYRGALRTLAGPSVDLDSRAYSVLALVLHELSTNAAKYGALSVPDGHLDVTWNLNEAGDLELDWREANGPPVMAPRRKGFGSVLLNRSIPFDLGGESVILYELDGVKAHFRVPARFVAASTHVAPTTEAAPAPEDRSALLADRKVLLVEDQLVIAIDVEGMLSGLGAVHIDTAATAAEGLRILQATTPDVCVLDVNLGSGTSLSVADELLARRIPFIFATGYGDSITIPERMGGVPVIRKPYEPESLASGLAEAFDRSA